MANEILRNRNERCIGEIETRCDGTRILYDATGHQKGKYDANLNVTYDESNCRIGEGNLLASLVNSSPLLGSRFAWGIGGYLLGRMNVDTRSEEYEPGGQSVEYLEDYSRILTLTALAGMVSPIVYAIATGKCSGNMVGVVLTTIISLAIIATLARLLPF